MAEAIGITLAVLPLLISAAEHYDDILQPFVRYRNFTSKLDRFQQRLKIQRTVFRNECRILLESAVEHDVALGMLDDKNHPQWVDRSVDNRLLQQLDSSKDACITIITQIEEQLRNVKKDSQEFEAAIEQSGQVYTPHSVYTNLTPNLWEGLNWRQSLAKPCWQEAQIRFLTVEAGWQLGRPESSQR